MRATLLCLLLLGCGSPRTPATTGPIRTTGTGGGTGGPSSARSPADGGIVITACSLCSPGATARSPTPDASSLSPPLRALWRSYTYVLYSSELW